MTETLDKRRIVEANQAVAVDAEHFYAIDNHAIAKYAKDTGELVDRWAAPASGPFCNRDIALMLMTARGMDTNNDRLVKLIAKRVGCCLRIQRDQRRVVSEEGPGQTVVRGLA